MKHAIENYNRRGVGSYKGLKIQASGRLHQVAIKMIRDLGLTRGKCLDLGAGSGAFSIRLKDAGFEVEVVDVKPLSLAEHGINVHKLDLNSDFSSYFSKGKFELITALEVIEHLENPFHFMRACSTILPPGGHLLITTPNLESWMSRLFFLYYGKFPWFSVDHFTKIGHITPQFSWLLPLIAEKCGFSLKKQSHTSNKFMIYAGPNNVPAIIVKRLCLILIKPLIRGNKDGDVNLFLFQKLNNRARKRRSPEK